MAQGAGKLGILLPGMGAVATTFIAGVDAIRNGRAAAIGSLTQLGQMNLGGDEVAIRDALGLASLDDIVFGGWYIYEDTYFDAAVRAGVLNYKDMEASREFLSSISPMPAVFEQDWVKVRSEVRILLILAIGFSIVRRCFLALQDPSPKNIQIAIKHALISLIVLDAAVAVQVADAGWGVGILALLIPATYLGKKVYST